MKVLFVSTNNLSDNGISTFIINNSKLLSDKWKVNVNVLAPNYVSESIKNNLSQSNVRVLEIYNRNSNTLKYFGSLISLLRHEKYDIIHVNGSSTIMSVELAAAFLAGIKVRIAHSHNTVTEHNRLNKLLRLPFDMFVNCRIACNEAAGKWLFKNKSFSIIDNGILLDSYRYNSSVRTKLRNKMGVRPDEVLIGHVGEFNNQKNQEFLLDVLKNLDAHYKLILVGHGPLLNKVKDKAKELGLSNRIIFPGSVNNVPDYLSAMDIFTLPSHFEGQPFVAVEAAANGLEMIISDLVSQEIDLTNKMSFRKLDTSVWVKSILNTKLKNRGVESADNISILASKGYDINTNVQKLYMLYKKQFNRIKKI